MKIINILTADNLATDGSKFEKSYQILEEARTNTTAAIENIAHLCEEETIKNLIDQDKVDKYSYELYLQFMYTEDDLKTLKETKQKMETLSADLNLFFDKVEQMLKMLENNSGSWTVEDGQLYFDRDDLVDEYNALYEELNQIVTEKFSTYEKKDDQIQQSNI